MPLLCWYFLENMNLRSRLVRIFIVVIVSVSMAQSEDWVFYHQQATKFYQDGDLKQAISYFEKTRLVIHKDLGVANQNYLTTSSNLAMIYAELGDGRSAEALYLEVDSIYKTHAELSRADYALNLLDLAALYEQNVQYDKAIPLYHKAIQIRKSMQGVGHFDCAQPLNNLALLYYKQQKPLQAEPLYLEALNIYKNAGHKSDGGYLAVLKNLSVLYEKQHEWAKAEPLRVELTHLCKKRDGEASASYRSNLSDLAFLYQQMGDHVKAEASYMDIIQVYKGNDLEHDPAYATALTDLAYLHEKSGNMVGVESLYLEAMDTFRKFNATDEPDYGLVLNNLALLYAKQGQYAKAEPLYLENLQLVARIFGKQHMNYTSLLSNLADLYESEGNYEKAELYYQEAIDVRKKNLGEKHNGYATSVNNLAVLYESQGKYAAAEALYVEAIHVLKDNLGESHPDYATTLYNLAYCDFRQGNYHDAEALLTEAVRIHKSTLGAKHTSYATSLNGLAVLYENRREYSRAESMYVEVLSLRRELLGEQHPDYAISLNNLALCYVNQGKYAQAAPLYIEIKQNLLNQIENNFYALSEKERSYYVNMLAHSFEYFNAFASIYSAEMPQIIGDVYDCQLAIKALLYNSTHKMQQRIVQGHDEALKQLYHDWQSKREALAAAYQLSKEEQQLQGIVLAQLEERANVLEKNLSRKSQMFAHLFETKTPTWNDVRKVLKPGECAIEVVRFISVDQSAEDSVHYMILILRPDMVSHPEMILLHNGSALEHKYASYYGNALKYRFADMHSYEQYWAKIAQQLQGVHKVYLSCDGVYNQINLLTLQNPQTLKYLFEELEIQQVSNTRDILSLRSHHHHLAGHHKGILLGHPNYGEVSTDMLSSVGQGSVPDLPETKEEVLHVKAICDKNHIEVEPYFDMDASEAFVKSIKNPRFLHIATHGFFLKDLDGPMVGEVMGIERKKLQDHPLLRSGLLLAQANHAFANGGDGILTALEAMNLNLDETDLVVLSACETGLGDVKNGEGVYGLQRAFQVAGARTVLMSLWSVADQATQELMTAFYENWLSHKQDKREAFKNAQQSLKAKYPDPFYWGAFVMVGE